MSLYSEEGENSRGRGKWSLKCSHDKGKEKDGRYHRSQANDGDESDNGDDKTDKGEISAGSRKYKKQAQALRVSIRSCSP